ncbi:Lrp/AsnC family transcriptional regulator [Nanoarchaeota archaeon]
MDIRLKLKNREVLYELDSNSRQSFSDIAKKVNLSKQVVAYNVKNMLDSSIIENFVTYINTSKLGFTTYKIFLKTQNIGEEKEEEIINFLRNHDTVTWCVSCDGIYDLGFNVMTRNVYYLNKFLSEFKDKFEEYVGEMDLHIMLKKEIFKRKYLVGMVKEVMKKIPEKTEEEIFQIDELNSKILEKLARNSRTNTVDIAKALNTTTQTITSRIKKMEKNNIITNYSINIDPNILNQLHHKILFKFQDLSREKEESFYEFCKTHPNIQFLSKTIGRYDAEINIEVRTTPEFRAIMKEIRKNFSDIIREYQLLNIYENHKVNYWPKAIY